MKSNLLKVLIALFVFGSAAVFGEEERKRPDFSEMRQKMEERMLMGIKGRMKSTDEEWEVIGPMVQNVMKLKGSGMNSAMRGAMSMRGRGGKGGPKPEGGEAKERPERAEGEGRSREGGRPDMEELRKKFQDSQPEEVKALREALQNEEASSEDIKNKLTAFRALRDEKKSALQSAQSELKSVLTVEQEAILVLSGIID